LLLLFYLQNVSPQGTFYSDLPDRAWFDLQVAQDGRIEAYIKGGSYYGDEDRYPNVFRNAIEINKETGTLLIAYSVAESSFRVEAHIMTVAVDSNSIRTGPPRDATSPHFQWFHDNMIIWYDESEKAHVMIYQEGCYSCWKYKYRNWQTNPSLDAKNQTLWKSMTYDNGETWTERVQLLSGVNEPHIHFQIIPSMDLNDDGFAKEVLIPVHHLDESVPESNFQMIYRCDRKIDPHDGTWTVVNVSASSKTELFGGYIQASVIRPDNEKSLIAFLRDRKGHWMGRSVSYDDGHTWTEPAVMPLPNADLMSQAIWLHSGNVMLVYNPQQSFPSGYDPGDRVDNSHILVVALSNDLGLTWQYAQTLEYSYDAMHLYPVGLQDPTCDNIYLTYSVETNEERVSCAAMETNPYIQTNAYEDCLKKLVTVDFIKFTVLHESWVVNPHSWGYDHEDCMWEIDESLKEKIAVLSGIQGNKISSSWFVSLESLSHSSARTIVITLLALIIITLACFSCVLLYFQYKIRI